MLVTAEVVNITHQLTIKQFHQLVSALKRRAEGQTSEPQATAHSPWREEVLNKTHQPLFRLLLGLDGVRRSLHNLPLGLSSLGLHCLHYRKTGRSERPEKRAVPSLQREAATPLVQYLS